MEMKRKKSLKVKIATLLTVICGLIALVSAFSDLLLSLYLSNKYNINVKDASSIGIIGGADGPTAIFLSGKISSHWITAVFALLMTLGIVYLVAARYRSKHNQ